MSDVLNQLRRAKELLENSGWTRGQYHVKRGDKDYYCALGALFHANEVITNEDSWSENTHKLCYAMKALGGATNQSRIYSAGARVTVYNDDYAKSKKDIIQLYDKAIEMVKEARQ
jgi:hypothetical protein